MILIPGLSDVDAITLSLASCVGQGTCTTQIGVTSIVIAAIANTLAKSGMVLALGAAAIVASGLAALWLA